MIELAVLGLLKEHPMHGYELKKRLREVLPPRAAISFGSLYPALGRLERDGSVVAAAAGTSLGGPPVPMTGSFSGEAAAFRSSRRVPARGPRNKKVYDITHVGEDRLAALLADPADDERTFPVKVALFRFAPPATRLGLLERRRATLVERLDERRRTMRSSGEGLDRYVRSLLEHDTETTEREIAWIDRLLAEERAADGIDTTSRRRSAPQRPPTAPTTTTTHPPSLLDGNDTALAADGGTR